MGWFNDRLEAADKRNQAVADYTRDRPDAGTTMFWWMNSRRGKRWFGVAMVCLVIVGILFGLLAALVLGLVVQILAWRFTDHPWLHGYTPKNKRRPEAPEQR